MSISWLKVKTKKKIKIGEGMKEVKLLDKERCLYERWGVIEHVKCHSRVSAVDLVLGILGVHL